MAETKTEVAFVLPADVAGGSSEPVTFPGFPGAWPPDQAVAVSAFDFASVAAARDARDEYAPALKEVRVAIGSAPMPERPNHIPLAEPAATPAAQEEAATDAGDTEPEPTVAELGTATEEEG